MSVDSGKSSPQKAAKNWTTCQKQLSKDSGNGPKLYNNTEKHFIWESLLRLGKNSRNLWCFSPGLFIWPPLQLCGTEEVLSGTGKTAGRADFMWGKEQRILYLGMPKNNSKMANIQQRPTYQPDTSMLVGATNQKSNRKIWAQRPQMAIRFLHAVRKICCKAASWCHVCQETY